jgi:hypothetical protein
MVDCKGHFPKMGFFWLQKYWAERKKKWSSKSKGAGKSSATKGKVSVRSTKARPLRGKG